MLILRRQGEVLLEKRPAAGIWGGLWSFPEIALGGDARRYSEERFGARVRPDGIMADIRHGFTHFALTIQPALLTVEQLEPRAQSPGYVWLTLDDAVAAAVPAPVRQILLRLRAGVGKGFITPSA